MRKQSLRHSANRYLKMDNRGSFKDKKHRAYIIHKMIDDLFAINNTPSSWMSMSVDQLKRLITYWKKSLQPATIMRYMTIIRYFLTNMGCALTDIDNRSLQLIRTHKNKRKITVQSDSWRDLSEACPRLIMALQTQFGLTYSEAIRLTPDIHAKEHTLWITREIAFNSRDRLIPFRNDTQRHIVNDLIHHTGGVNSLLSQYGDDRLRYQWRKALIERNLPTNKSYRYLYAQQMTQELQPILGSYQTSWLIRDEMGIASRNTLWLYLNE